MNHKLVRITLCALEVHAAVCTVAGGVALLAGVIRFPLAMLQGTLFSDYTIPALLLAIVKFYPRAAMQS